MLKWFDEHYEKRISVLHLLVKYQITIHSHNIMRLRLFFDDYRMTENLKNEKKKLMDE